MTDQELVHGLQKRNQTAFRELVEKFQYMVVNTCHNFLHDKDDAEDLAQDVFIEVYLSIHKFRGDSKLSTWLYRIAVNKSLNFIRENKKKRFIENIGEVLSGDKNKEAYSDENLKEQLEEKNELEKKYEILHRAINSLKKNQRIAFTLHKYDKLPYKEIAEVMELSLPAVEALIHRAKKNIQKSVLDHYKNNRKNSKFNSKDVSN